MWQPMTCIACSNGPEGQETNLVVLIFHVKALEVSADICCNVINSMRLSWAALLGDVGKLHWDT